MYVHTYSEAGSLTFKNHPLISNVWQSAVPLRTVFIPYPGNDAIHDPSIHILYRIIGGGMNTNFQFQIMFIEPHNNRQPAVPSPPPPPLTPPAGSNTRFKIKFTFLSKYVLRSPLSDWQTDRHN